MAFHLLPLPLPVAVAAAHTTATCHKDILSAGGMCECVCVCACMSVSVYLLHCLCTFVCRLRLLPLCCRLRCCLSWKWILNISWLCATMCCCMPQATSSSPTAPKASFSVASEKQNSHIGRVSMQCNKVMWESRLPTATAFPPPPSDFTLLTSASYCLSYLLAASLLPHLVCLLLWFLLFFCILSFALFIRFSFRPTHFTFYCISNAFFFSFYLYLSQQQVGRLIDNFDFSSWRFSLSLARFWHFLFPP